MNGLGPGWAGGGLWSKRAARSLPVRVSALLLLMAVSLTRVARAADQADPSGPPPQVSAGRLERLPWQSWHGVPARPIDVWLPPGYPAAAPYAVLYVHDGQMLFDGATTWNGLEWRFDETASALIAAGLTRPFLVVGIGNRGAERVAEYFPQTPFESLSAADRERVHAAISRRAGRPVAIRSDAYLRFLTSELKPYIDRHYAVARGAADTMLLGASMGGLISLYGVAEYPQVFGGAACLSTHWPGLVPALPDNPVPAVFEAYIRQRLPTAGQHRFYFDHGTEGLDGQYGPYQRRVDALMQARGYRAVDWQTRVFPAAAHDEKAWAARLPAVLTFLLPPRT